MILTPDLSESLITCCYGDLVIIDLDISQFPINLTMITGNVYIGGSKIKKLPDNLVIGGSLNISKTKIKKLPENLTVNGSLDISETKIKKLPKSLDVRGSIEMHKTKIRKLPDNLHVKGDLFCDENMVIPESVKVDGGIYKVRKRAKLK